MSSIPSVGVAIITHNAKHHLKRCLPPYLNSPLHPRVLVVNTSTDGTVEAAEAMGAETLRIPRGLFNHGATREAARRHLGTDIVVMVTPDAYAKADTLEALVKPLLEGEASVAYARQLPHEGAGVFEAFAREFNYPSESHIRTLKDVDKYGVYTFFCSNSCAAYKNDALDLIGGFPSLLLGEDTVAVAKLLKMDHAIAYVAEAEIYHSHGYTIKQEFQRCFDIGLARKSYSHLLEVAGKDHARGAAYTKSLAARLLATAPHLLPYAALQTVVKWVGYAMGQRSTNAPKWLKKACSSQDFYWE